MTTMRAFAVSHRKLRAVSHQLPSLRPGWALIRVRLAGVCNTDLEILRGYHDFRGVPGHEFVGQVERVHPSAKENSGWVGRRVAGEINVGCASLGRRSLCGFCRRGIVTHCEHRQVLGIVNLDGAFAEYLALPLTNLHRVPDALADEQAVFTEPLAAACQILEQVRIAGHGEAAVLGDGKLAQLIARVLHSAGLAVMLFGRHAEKLALARAAGIAGVRLGRGELPKTFRRRYTLLVEATGSPSGLVLAQAMAAPRGTVVLKSTFHGTAEVETWPAVVNELTLIGSRCGPFPRALSLLRKKLVDPRPLITRVFPLGRAPEAMEFAAKRGVMKVLLQP